MGWPAGWSGRKGADRASSAVCRAPKGPAPRGACAAGCGPGTSGFQGEAESQKRRDQGPLPSIPLWASLFTAGAQALRPGRALAAPRHSLPSSPERCEFRSSRQCLSGWGAPPSLLPGSSGSPVRMCSAGHPRTRVGGRWNAGSLRDAPVRLLPPCGARQAASSVCAARPPGV